MILTSERYHAHRSTQNVRSGYAAEELTDETVALAMSNVDGVLPFVVAALRLRHLQDTVSLSLGLVPSGWAENDRVSAASR